MKVNVQSVHFHADAKLLSYIERKMDRLSRTFDRIESVDVMLKLQDNGGKVQEKISEIKLQVQGGWLLDKKTGRSFETALNASIDTLKRQLVRHKEKVNTFRREA
ncbi:MAG: ribosome-associated translation inhibitor RaiA [Lewinellaceae bacterium]|nr:ribosome-associated translation inhibitor RaiA [Lewinellaceae bacterium]